MPKTWKITNFEKIFCDYFVWFLNFRRVLCSSSYVCKQLQNLRVEQLSQAWFVYSFLDDGVQSMTSGRCFGQCSASVWVDRHRHREPKELWRCDFSLTSILRPWGSAQSLPNTYTSVLLLAAPMHCLPAIWFLFFCVCFWLAGTLL